METTLNFEAAVYLSWVAGLMLIYLWKYFLPVLWPPFRQPRYEKPLKEFLLSLLAVAALLCLSVLTYSAREFFTSLLGKTDFSFVIKLLIVYSPIFIFLIATKQTLATCFISLEKIQYKIIIGVFSALVAGYVFGVIRGGNNYPAFLNYVWHRAGVHLIQAFLEGVAVGFLLYRLFALFNPYVASAIVAVIFMLSHFQSYTTGMGYTSNEAAILIAAHTGITYVILMFVYKTQDLISVFFLHWIINAATGFTSQ